VTDNGRHGRVEPSQIANTAEPASRTADVTADDGPEMDAFQEIRQHGKLVAAVVADRAIIADGVEDEQLRHVKAMCMYALEVLAGERPGPYTDLAADRYANSVTAC
jgi:hypothetical protein